MLLDVTFMMIGLVLLAGGAEALVRGASNLALRLGITPLVVGLTIVAFATGSPELAISVKGAVTGNSGIALGNVIGSNISNLALILGLAALVRPMKVQSRLIKREVPIMVLSAALLLVLLLDGSLSRLDGILLAACAAAYLFFTYRSAAGGETPKVAEEFEEGARERGWSTLASVAAVIVGVGALVLGAEWLVNGAVAIAEALDISQAVIALTIIAVGTSLPELATSLTAARANNPDVAFGNVVGSNTLNVLAIIGIAAIISPFEVEGLRPLDLAMFMGTTILMLPLLVRGWVLNRWEGLVLVTLYVAYLVSLVG